jgi:hypothetical protein
MIMSPALILEYFDSVGVKKECPACGRDQWFLHENTEQEGTGAIRMRTDGVSLENLRTSLIYVFAICENCGYIRQHARPMIVRWAKARQGGGERDAG